MPCTIFALSDIPRPFTGFTCVKYSPVLLSQEAAAALEAQAKAAAEEARLREEGKRGGWFGVGERLSR